MLKTENWKAVLAAALKALSLDVLLIAAVVILSHGLVPWWQVALVCALLRTHLTQAVALHMAKLW
jgi:hypothetical protein